jgi:hypothetical protein
LSYFNLIFYDIIWYHTAMFILFSTFLLVYIWCAGDFVWHFHICIQYIPVWFITSIILPFLPSPFLKWHQQISNIRVYVFICMNMYPYSYMCRKYINHIIHCPLPSSFTLTLPLAHSPYNHLFYIPVLDCFCVCSLFSEVLSWYFT